MAADKEWKDRRLDGPPKRGFFRRFFIECLKYTLLIGLGLVLALLSSYLMRKIGY